MCDIWHIYTAIWLEILLGLPISSVHLPKTLFRFWSQPEVPGRKPFTLGWSHFLWWALCTWGEPCDILCFPAHSLWCGHRTKLQAERCSRPMCTPPVLRLLMPRICQWKAGLGISNLSFLWQGGSDASLKNRNFTFMHGSLHEHLN